MKDRYDKLKSAEIYISETIPRAFFPNPETKNYKDGFIERYFFQKRASEGSPIYEVNRDVFVKDFFPYKKVSIKWHIIGELEDKWEGETYKPSVITKNKRELQKVDKTMPDLKLYLVNLKQFWKPL